MKSTTSKLLQKLQDIKFGRQKNRMKCIHLSINVSTALGRSWIYQVSPFVIQEISTIGNKTPNREFYWALDHEFYYGLGI